jgi:hypothetical protein
MIQYIDDADASFDVYPQNRRQDRRQQTIN